MKLHDFLVITKLQIAIMTKTFFSSVSLISLLFCFFYLGEPDRLLERDRDFDLENIKYK